MKKFVHVTRVAYRVVDIGAANQTRTAADRDPKTSATPHQHPR
jgi:hypothetical protein